MNGHGPVDDNRPGVEFGRVKVNNFGDNCILETFGNVFGFGH